MKKTLALVLAVVMIAGFAMTASAATYSIDADDSSFNVVINNAVDKNVTLSQGPTSNRSTIKTLQSGDIVTLQDFALYLDSSSAFASPTNLDNESDWTLAVSAYSGSSYVSNSGFELKQDAKKVTFGVTNTTGSTKTVEVKLTFSRKSGGAEAFASKSYIFKFQVETESGTGSTYDMTAANNTTGSWPLNSSNTYVSLDAGTGSGQFGAIAAAVITHLKGIDDGEIEVFGENYEMKFLWNAVGTSSKSDILGTRGLTTAFTSANQSLVDDNLVEGIKSINGSSTIATFKLLNVSQDFIDAYKSKGNSALIVYDANGNKTTYSAKWDSDDIVFTAPVGSYVVSGSTDVKAVAGTSSSSTTTSSSKTNPNTGK